jgi:hypothetical protein
MYTSQKSRAQGALTLTNARLMLLIIQTSRYVDKRSGVGRARRHTPRTAPPTVRMMKPTAIGDLDLRGTLGMDREVQAEVHRAAVRGCKKPGPGSFIEGCRVDR